MKLESKSKSGRAEPRAAVALLRLLPWLLL
jgi:hypothetical protein